MKAYHVLVVLFSFMSFLGDNKCYQHLVVDIKSCVMYLMLYSALKLQVKGTLSNSSKIKNQIKW